MADFSAAKRDEKQVSFCVWSKHVLTWLPKTEFVGLYDEQEEQADVVSWERLQAVVGHLMNPLGCYSPRWLVDGFPSRDEIEKMNPEN